MMSITVIHPPADAGWADQRLRDVLRFALAGQEFRTVSTAGELDNLAGQKLLFALPLGDAGVNLEYLRILTRPAGGLHRRAAGGRGRSAVHQIHRL